MEKNSLSFPFNRLSHFVSTMAGLWFQKVLPHAFLLSIISTTVNCGSILHPSVSFDGPFEVEANGMHNVKITYTGPVNGEFSIHYGSCTLTRHEEAHHCLGKTHVGSHPLAKRHLDWEYNRPTKFVWLPREDSPNSGCLHAFLGKEVIGRSPPIRVSKRQERRSTAFADIADAMGPWFDGVVHLQEKEPDEVFVASAKSKTIGIVGGGMSGLMSSVS